MEYEETISIDYDNALHQAGVLKEAANQCNDVIKRMNQLIDKLPETWKGASGSLMLEKCQEWVRNQQRESDMIYLQAVLIEQKVQNMREAEGKVINEIHKC